MKLNVKNNMQQAEQKRSHNQSQRKKKTSWEMSAQDALRVDYVTAQQCLPAHS